MENGSCGGSIHNLKEESTVFEHIKSKALVNHVPRRESQILVILDFSRFNFRINNDNDLTEITNSFTSKVNSVAQVS